MLLASPRHTVADLELWAELEAADAAHCLTVGFQRRVSQALEDVERFLQHGPAFVACSWGKDSVVVADLVQSVAPVVPVAWIRVEPIVQPDCDAVRDAFGTVTGQYLEVVRYCRCDRYGWHATGTLEAGSREVVKLLGTDRRIMGIRADESSTRSLSAAVHGVATEHVCRPILRWTSEDVFAYLHKRGLPVHPAYACLGGGRYERGRIRVASLGGRRGEGMGRREWEREYYGDVLRAIELEAAISADRSANATDHKDNA